MKKIATPISTLFAEHDNSVQKIVSSSDCLEGRDHSLNWDFNYELFHSDIQPVHVLKNRDWCQLEEIKKNSKNLKLVSFHIATCCDQPFLDKRGVYQIGGIVYDRNQMIDNASMNIDRIKSFLSSDTTVALENNNWLESSAYQDVTDADFISEVVQESGTSFLFDYAHAFITSNRKRVAFSEYMSQLPLERTAQVHFSKCSLVNGKYVDSHGHLDTNDIDEIWEKVRDLPAKYFTIEYYKEVNGLIKMNHYLKQLLSGNS